MKSDKRNRDNLRKAIDKLEKARSYFNDTQQYKNCIKWAMLYIDRASAKKSCLNCRYTYLCQDDQPCVNCGPNYNKWKLSEGVNK